MPDCLHRISNGHCALYDAPCAEGPCPDCKVPTDRELLDAAWMLMLHCAKTPCQNCIFALRAGKSCALSSDDLPICPCDWDITKEN